MDDEGEFPDFSIFFCVPLPWNVEKSISLTCGILFDSIHFQRSPYRIYHRSERVAKQIQKQSRVD